MSKNKEEVKPIFKETKFGNIVVYEAQMKYLGTIVNFVDGYAGYMGNEGESVIFEGEPSKEEAKRKVRDYSNNGDDSR